MKGPDESKPRPCAKHGTTPSLSRRARLLEDAEDLAAFEEREDEPALLFTDAVRDLRQRGKL